MLWATVYISCSILFCHVHETGCESVLHLLVRQVLTSASCMTYMGWFSWEQTVKFYSYTQSQYPTFWVRMGEDILQKMLLNTNNKIALTLRFVSQLVEDQPLPVLGNQTVERRWEKEWGEQWRKVLLSLSSIFDCLFWLPPYIFLPHPTISIPR